MCNRVLDSCQKLETEVFVLHFMLSKLSDQICPTTKIQELKNRLLGAKVSSNKTFEQANG